MQQSSAQYRDTGGGMEMVTPSTTLRIRNGKLEQRCTVQKIGNNGPPGYAYSDWIAVPEITEKG